MQGKYHTCQIKSSENEAETHRFDNLIIRICKQPLLQDSDDGEHHDRIGEVEREGEQSLDGVG